MLGGETAPKSDPWAEKDPHSVEVSVIDPCALSAFTPVWRLRAVALLTPAGTTHFLLTSLPVRQPTLI